MERDGKEAVLLARAELETLTPLRGNCGRYCGAACCDADETFENGMLLLPYEDELYDEPIEGFPFHLRPDNTLYLGGKALVCEGECRREARPFACRVFPLRLRVSEDNVKAELDPRAWAVCPLCERGGVKGMSAEFVAAAERAGRILLENPVIKKALLREQKTLDESRHL